MLLHIVPCLHCGRGCPQQLVADLLSDWLFGRPTRRRRRGSAGKQLVAEVLGNGFFCRPTCGGGKGPTCCESSGGKPLSKICGVSESGEGGLFLSLLLLSGFQGLQQVLLHLETQG